MLLELKVHFVGIITIFIRTRGHTLKLSKTMCTRDCWKYFVSNRVVNRWNMLDQQTVGATSLNAFKNELDTIRKTKMGFFRDCSAKP